MRGLKAINDATASGRCIRIAVHQFPEMLRTIGNVQFGDVALQRCQGRRTAGLGRSRPSAEYDSKIEKDISCVK